ncbi:MULTISPECIES: ATP-binding protein [Paracoccus]|uniref:ATP-binding protein n=1 Tax=Paracoccus TaxID=265 RepID=UPI000A4819CD|nr:MULTISPECIES: ATP-binding protein [Paracoccus]
MSIRLRLIVVLTLVTGVLWMSAVLWIAGSTRAQVERVLDARLAESANMVSSLISDRRIAVEAEGPARVPMPATADLSRQLSCQIWSLRGDLIGASQGAPDARMALTEGFSTTVIDGVPWRVYAVRNQQLGVRVIVGDRVDMRDGLVAGVVSRLLWPAAVLFPLLAGLIWLSVGRGLAPLAQLEAALRARRPDDLRPLPDARDPREIRPVRRALNRLFQQLDQIRRTERDFTAFAAHELKTPLAGLRIQAQVARRAADAATRDRALDAIAVSVDRSDRMVRQLLELAAIDHESAPSGPLDPAALIAEIVQDAQAQASAAQVRLVVRAEPLDPIHAPRVLMHSALRNLVENAIQHSPPGGQVTVMASRGASGLCLAVTDQGPGIAPEDRHRVTRRFWRGRAATGQGSGLGLAIVAAAVAHLGARLDLDAPDGGQTVRITLPDPARRS